MRRGVVGWVGGALRVLRLEIRERWRRLFLLSLAGVVAYQFLLLAPFARYGSFPNYFKAHNVPAAILDDIRLGPPPAELWALVTDEPIYEFGVQDRFGFIALQFVATPHSLFTMLALPPLVVLSLLLLARSLAVLRQRGAVAVGAAGVSTSTVASLFGASTSAVACCGASSGPVLLTMLGFGFGTAGVIVEHAEILEAGGYLLLLGNLVGLAGWLGRHDSREMSARGSVRGRSCQALWQR